MKQNELKTVFTKVNNIYNWGCYFLDLLYVAFNREPTLDEILRYYDRFNTLGFMDEECYVKNAASILTDLTGKKYRCEKADEIAPDADFVIGRYYNKRTDYHHFVVMNKLNLVEWDSIQNSVTVREGYIEDYRLFYECD